MISPKYATYRRVLSVSAIYVLIGTSKEEVSVQSMKAYGGVVL
jgi:hypothetical protein